ncbi:MAG: hypothetical protein ACYCWW_08025 [Deltaproteobacteria bacterium]
MRKLTCLAMLLVALPAIAGEVHVKGGRKPLVVKGDAGGAYHPIGLGWPVAASVVGPGDLTLGLRVQVPETGEGRATVHVSVDGSEILQVPLDGATAGRFKGRHPTAPGPLVLRRIRIGDGPHELVVSTEGGSAVVSLRLTGGPPPGALALAPLTAAPLAPAPLTPEALTPAPLTLEPLTAAPLTATPLGNGASDHSGVKPRSALAQRNSAPPLDAAAEPPGEVHATTPTDGVHHRTFEYYLLGGAGLLAVGATVSFALASGANSSYVSTPEVRGGSSTNRSQILARANDDLGWAKGLGAAAVLLLAGAAISLTF